MSPQRPRPPQPGRAAPSGRPAAPRPAPEAFRGSDEATAPVQATGARTGTGRATTAPAAGAAHRPATSARRTAGSSATALTPRRSAGSSTPVDGVLAQGSAARFAERARAHRRLTQRRMLIATGVLLVAAGLGWLLFVSPVLALRSDQVQISGAGSVVAVDQVQAVIDAHEGVPLLRLDTSALRVELLAVPGVRDVTVTRQWPHGLSVALVAREPVAAVPEDSGVVQSEDGTTTGSGYALVDDEGVQVGRADAAPDGLPVVDVPVGQERVLTAVLGVLDELPDDLLAQVGQVSATTQDSVNFTLRDGAAVEWGSDQDSALKAAVLSALRAAPETAGAARYDVSAPTMPVVG